MSGLVCSTGTPGGGPRSLRPAARPGRVPCETADGRAQGGWPSPRAEEAGPRSPQPRPNREGAATSSPRAAPEAAGAETTPAQVEAEVELGRGPAGQGAFILTDQPDSEHQLSVRCLSRSHFPPPQRTTPSNQLAGPAPAPGQRLPPAPPSHKAPPRPLRPRP